jgi:hypothetical protein
MDTPGERRCYNNKDLTPLGFLTEVYRATNLPLVVRIRAADECCKILLRTAPWLFQPPSCTVTIPGIFRDKDGNPIPDTIELIRDMIYIKKCWDNGINPNLDMVPAKGHA